MEKDFCVGLLLGMVGGALIVANSYKVRKTVKDGQQQLMDAICKLKREQEQKKEENVQSHEE